MIIITIGSNLKERKTILSKGEKDFELVYKESSSFDNLKMLSLSLDLFGGKKYFVFENSLSDSDKSLGKDILEMMSVSPNTFSFFEDSMLVSEEKKYTKYAEINRFAHKEIKKEIVNVFDIGNSFARKDKIATWSLYVDAIGKGVSPEEISGMLFWKVKTMILNNDRSFLQEDLKEHLVSIVDMYHRAHRGEIDFSLAFESFLLKALSR